jgi:hypothetical protein
MLHFVRLSSAILSPEFAPTRAFVHVAVFNELSRLLRGAGTEIHGEERLRGGQAAPREKFIRAKLIGINRVPGFVENGGSISSGADAIQPVIAGNKISSGIADDGNAEFADFVQDIFAETVGVGEFRLRIVDAS